MERGKGREEIKKGRKERETNGGDEGIGRGKGR